MFKARTQSAIAFSCNLCAAGGDQSGERTSGCWFTKRKICKVISMSKPTVRAAAEPLEPKWHDRKRYLWPLGLIVPLFPFAGGALAFVSGWNGFWFLGPILILGVIPLIDLLTGVDQSNPPDELIESLENDRYYRWVTYLFLPLQYLALVWACWLWSSGSLTLSSAIGLATTVGIVAGVGINTAHELGHKRVNAERWLAKVALAQSFYGHFYIEHNRGHHVRVATPNDPASARLGESLYRFLPRTVIGSVRNAWRIEQPRFARRQQTHVSIRNDVLNAWLMSAVLWIALLLIFGVGVLPFLLIQAVVGIVLLECVNYLEHYGLARQREANGRWERVLPSHSWNSNNIATNVLLYHLQRHSDHHANPTRRYQSLRDVAAAPVLPTGYAGMIVLAAIPPLWFRVMDPKVLRHYRGDLGLANIDSRDRVRLTKKYANASSGQAHSPVTGQSPTRATRATRATVEQSATATVQPGRHARYRCDSCGYTYSVATGAPREGIHAGTLWADVPSDWPCPDCGVREKVDFMLVAAESTQ